VGVRPSAVKSCEHLRGTKIHLETTWPEIQGRSMSGKMVYEEAGLRGLALQVYQEAVRLDP
jgi:hypothetical protein